MACWLGGLVGDVNRSSRRTDEASTTSCESSTAPTTCSNEVIRAIVLEDSHYLPHGLGIIIGARTLTIWSAGMIEIRSIGNQVAR